VIAAILTQEPPPLATDLSPMPETLRQIVARALVKDKEARYQTAAEMLTDLKTLKGQMEFGLQSQPAESQARGVAMKTSAHLFIDTGESRLDPTTDAALVRPTSGASAITAFVRPRKRALMLVALLVVTAIALAAYLLIRRSRSTDQAPPFATFKVSRMTTTGRASFAAISPDGKYAVHVMGSAGQPSLWLRHIATGSDKEILPAVQGMLSGLRFSKDGSYIYYDQLGKTEVTLYRVPVLGGIPQKLVSDIDTAVSFSPDGARMAYVRGLPLENQAALIIANADGSNEQRLAMLPIQLVYPTLAQSMMQTWGPAWSPDGEALTYLITREGVTNIWAQPVDGSSAKPVTEFKSDLIFFYDWSRDGKKLAYARGLVTNDAVLITDAKAAAR
jgi:hypothetical protein